MSIARDLEKTEFSDNINSVINIGEFIAYFAETTEQLNKAYRLRHQVFCEELGWVPTNDFELESDEFDANAKIICVENTQGEVVGTNRLVDSKHGWISEKCFPQTIAGDITEVKKNSIVESSRIAIHPDLRNKSIPGSSLRLQDVLFLMAMDYAWDNLKRSNILVTVTPLFAMLYKRKGLAFTQIGPIVTMDDGCKIASYQVDIEVSKDTYTPYAKFHQETQGYLKAC